MDNLTPIFSTDHSIGEAILTVDDESEIKPNKTVSVVAITDTYKLPITYVVERGMSSYWKLYAAFAQRPETQLAFGVKINVCAKLPEAEGSNTTSSIIVFFKNTQAYFDMVKMYSAATVRHKTAVPTLDWDMLSEFITPNMLIVIPFYSGFLARNLLTLNCSALPNFGAIRPIFLLEEHGLPFDGLISEAVRKYCEQNKYDTMVSHNIYYYLDEDIVAHQTFQCINKRTTLEKPNLEHYSSNEFSFESFLRKAGEELDRKSSQVSE